MRVVRAFQYEKIEQPRASLRASSTSHIESSSEYKTPLRIPYLLSA
jgi:hypothetical protein